MYKIVCVLCSLVFFSGAVTAGSQVYSISTDDWARPRNGKVLLEYEPLQHLIQDWGSGSGIIEIRFPGGEMGSLWASELRDWLVALGISSQNIHLLSGASGIDRIDLVISRP